MCVGCSITDHIIYAGVQLSFSSFIFIHIDWYYYDARIQYIPLWPISVFCYTRDIHTTFVALLESREINLSLWNDNFSCTTKIKLRKKQKGAIFTHCEKESNCYKINNTARKECFEKSVLYIYIICSIHISYVKGTYMFHGRYWKQKTKKTHTHMLRDANLSRNVRISFPSICESKALFFYGKVEKEKIKSFFPVFAAICIVVPKLICCARFSTKKRPTVGLVGFHFLLL